MPEEKNTADLDDAAKVALAAFEKIHPEYFTAPGKTHDQLRDEYAKAYKDNPRDRTNAFTEFYHALHHDGELQPDFVPTKRPHLTDAELDALQKDLQAKGMAQFKALSSQGKQEKEPVTVPGHRFNELYSASSAGEILLPLAMQMDAQEGGNRYVHATGDFLQSSYSLDANIETEEELKKFHLPLPTPPAKIDATPLALTLGLLQKNQGVFYGECHGDHNSTDFIIKNAKQLKAAGVDKMFLELDPRYLQDLKDGPEKKPDSFLWKNNMREISTGWRNMVLAAEAANIKVIADDHVEFQTPSGHIGYDNITDFAGTFSGIVQRNEDEAAVINREKGDGKFIIYGGSAHSGNVKAGEFSDEVANHGIAYRGVDKQVGIPSIDFTSSSLPPGVYHGDGRNADYNVMNPTEALVPSSVLLSVPKKAAPGLSK